MIEIKPGDIVYTDFACFVITNVKDGYAYGVMESEDYETKTFILYEKYIAKVIRQEGTSHNVIWERYKNPHDMVKETIIKMKDMPAEYRGSYLAEAIKDINRCMEENDID